MHQISKKKFLVHQQGAACAEIGKCDDKPMSYVAALHFVHNYYGPYAYCSLDKGVAYTRGGGPSGDSPVSTSKWGWGKDGGGLRKGDAGVQNAYWQDAGGCRKW